MNLHLDRPLCVFDLETTGTNINKDKIVEICILKVFPNGNKESKTWRVNPEISIPLEVSLVHGIYDSDVAHSPTFKEVAPLVIEMLKGSDIGGFNSNKFDVPLLGEEILRAGYIFDIEDHRLIDAQVIFHKKEPRNLSAAYKFYCNKDLVNAHSAEADTLATFEILDAQVGKYSDIGTNAKELSELNYSKLVDLAGMLVYNSEGEVVFNFGKYKSKSVKEVFSKDLGYYAWIQNADFPLYTKKILTKIQLSK